MRGAILRRMHRPALERVIFSLCLFLAACGGSGAKGPNVIVITLDTTRADHLGCYGYERDTSPNLDVFAEKSLLFERAYSTSSWTLPSHASLFTGKFPRSHGARYDPEGPLVITNAIAGPDYWDQYRARGIARDERTLALLLQADGYRTGAFVAGPWMKRVFGLDAGFDVYDDSGIDATNGRLAADVTSAARSWLAADPENGEPFFLFLNYYDPHFPLQPPASFRNLFAPPGGKVEDLSEDEGIHALYDAEIRYMDQQLGVLFQSLKKDGLWDRSWVVITADHGELLGENEEIGHGRYLTQSELHVPLLVKAPLDHELPKGRISDPVQLTDVLPFLLEELGKEVPTDVQGDPLLDVRHPIVAEVYPLEIMSGAGDWEALIQGELKFARSSLGVHLLHDVVKDGAEASDLGALRPDDLQAMDERLTRFLEALPPPGDAGPEQIVDDETSRALQGLGYGGGEPR